MIVTEQKNEVPRPAGGMQRHTPQRTQPDYKQSLHSLFHGHEPSMPAYPPRSRFVSWPARREQRCRTPVRCRRSSHRHRLDSPPPDSSWDIHFTVGARPLAKNPTPPPGGSQITSLTLPFCALQPAPTIQVTLVSFPTRWENSRNPNLVGPGGTRVDTVEKQILIYDSSTDRASSDNLTLAIVSERRAEGLGGMNHHACVTLTSVSGQSVRWASTVPASPVVNSSTLRRPEARTTQLPAVARWKPRLYRSDRSSRPTPSAVGAWPKDSPFRGRRR